MGSLYIPYMQPAIMLYILKQAMRHSHNSQAQTIPQQSNATRPCHCHTPSSHHKYIATTSSITPMLPLRNDELTVRRVFCSLGNRHAIVVLRLDLPLIRRWVRITIVNTIRRNTTQQSTTTNTTQTGNGVGAGVSIGEGQDTMLITLNKIVWGV
jgi:hypothetical protein